MSVRGGMLERADNLDTIVMNLSSVFAGVRATLVGCLCDSFTKDTKLRQACYPYSVSSPSYVEALVEHRPPSVHQMRQPCVMSQYAYAKLHCGLKLLSHACVAHTTIRRG
jgi:hypothetical protein